jgi:hypothetical protein
VSRSSAFLGGVALTSLLSDVRDGFEAIGTSERAMEDDPLYEAVHRLGATVVRQERDPRVMEAKVLATLQNWEAVIAHVRGAMAERGATPLGSNPVLRFDDEAEGP